MSSQNEQVRVECRIEKETAKAILVAQEDPDDPDMEITVWLPLSQISRMERGRPSEEYGDSVWIPQWLAKTKEKENGLQYVD